ncbi:MAG TPA: response regulator [Gammaproteobacteria bacterium]|nr:response regulator [Gammaproteobacteria bacterium]
MISASARGREGSAPHGRQAGFTSCRVLIADDHVDAAIGLAEWLETMGYEVYTAYDGNDALETARRVKPDALLLDITMPGIDGDEVCRRLRREPWARNVLIAAVTGYSGAEERQRSREAGFDHHFVKPVDPRKIRDLLQSL